MEQNYLTDLILSCQQTNQSMDDFTIFTTCLLTSFPVNVCDQQHMEQKENQVSFKHSYFKYM